MDTAMVIGFFSLVIFGLCPIYLKVGKLEAKIEALCRLLNGKDN